MKWAKIVVRKGISGCLHIDRLWAVELVSDFTCAILCRFNRKRDAVVYARKWARRLDELNVEVRGDERFFGKAVS